MGEGAESALRVTGKLLFDPFCGVRPPENGPMAKGNGAKIRPVLDVLPVSWGDGAFFRAGGLSPGPA